METEDNFNAENPYIAGVPTPIVDEPGLTPIGRASRTVRSFLTNLWFGGIKLAHLRTGFNSVNYGAKITFLDDQTTSAAGQLGMDTSTGRLQVFIGGANRSVLGAHECVGVDGMNAMAADLSLGSNQINDLAPATLSTDAPTWGQVTDFVVAAVDALEWADGVTVATTEAIAAGATVSGSSMSPAGNGAFPTVDGVAPVQGNSYLLHNEGNTKDGVWTLTVVGNGSVPWTLTRRPDFGVGDAVAGRIIPVMSGTQYGGTDWRVSSASGSDVVGTHTLSISQRVVTNDHGTLVGLSDDDHTIYALLAGRSGGQSLVGGSGAGEHLMLGSTSHGTKGKIKLASGSITEMQGDDSFVPATNNTGSVGTASKKFANVYATNLVGGDMVMQAPDNEAARFVFYEASADRVTVVNPRTGRAWDLLTAATSRPATAGELARAEQGPTA